MKASPRLLSQVSPLFEGQPKRIRGHGEIPCGRRCYEIHLLGTVNAPTWTGADVIWGPEAAGSLYAEWNLHKNRYDRAWVSFPMPPHEFSLAIDVSEALPVQAVKA